MVSLLQLASNSNFILGIIREPRIRVVHSLISLCKYTRAKHLCARGKSMTVRDKMKISKYRGSWPARAALRIQEIMYLPPHISSVLWTKFKVYTFGSSWEKHDGADKKKSLHIIEGSFCALYAAWKFHSSTSQQYSTIKLRLLFAAFSDTLLYRWQRQGKSIEGETVDLLRLRFLILGRTERNHL